MSSRSSTSVLIVDAEGTAGRGARSLRDRGYTVLSAIDGASASWLIRRAHVDAVIVDLTAPGALEFLEEKAADDELAAVPVLLVTVFAEELAGSGYHHVMAPTLS